MLALYMSFIDDESHRRLFEKIYIEYRDPMFFMARSVLGNDSDAEDIVHDVFLKIAKKHMARISRIKNDTDLRNYLLTATKHTALDHLRKHRRERISADAEIEANTPDTIVLTNDAFVEKICNNIEYERILSAIVSMKDIYKERSYVLSFCDGFIHTGGSKDVELQGFYCKAKACARQEAALCAVIWRRKQ